MLVMTGNTLRFAIHNRRIHSCFFLARVSRYVLLNSGQSRGRQTVCIERINTHRMAALTAFSDGFVRFGKEPLPGLTMSLGMAGYTVL